MAIRNPLRARLRSLDSGLMRRSVSMRSPVLDRALTAITGAANYSRLWLAIAAVLAAIGGRTGSRAAARGLVAIAIAAFIANGPGKLLTRRRRPPADSQAPLIGMPRSMSFPSGHSAAAFAFATGACREWPLLAPLLMPLAAIVGYSRVHAGVHYPSDVAAGAVVGVGSGMLARSVSRPALRSLHARHQIGVPDRAAQRLGARRHERIPR